LTSTDAYQRLAQISGWIIDMDGVIYRDTEPIRGAAEFIVSLQEEQTPFVLLTNNSTRTPEQYVDKLADMKINVDVKQVLTSALATAEYLRRIARPSQRVYLIGEDGLQTAVQAAGFSLASDYHEAEYVVVGMDRNITFEALRQATLAIRRGAPFIGTNPDRTLPTPQGQIPGNGSILAALEAATDVEPFVIGKPQAPIFDWALQHLGLPKERVACLGDRLETDILGGNRAGLTTVFVLSGVSTREQLACFDPKPDLVFADPGELNEAWCRRPRHNEHRPAVAPRCKP